MADPSESSGSEPSQETKDVVDNMTANFVSKAGNG